MTDWRERYLQLADQNERAEQSHADAERELIRLVTRLCVATSGLDPVLDPHLNRLRQAAKGGKAETLLRRADEFADSLVSATEERMRPGVIAMMLERYGAAQRQVDEALKLWAAVAADPAAASDAQLDRLADALRNSLAAGAEREASRPGLLGRLIGKSGHKDDLPPNRVLLDLLQAVEWLDSLVDQVSAFRTELLEEGKEDAWVHVVREISDLAVRAMQQSQLDAQSAESFLTALNQRLEELDRHMHDEAQRRVESQASGERLGQSMDSAVGSLTESVRSSVSLSELQANVIRTLDRMQTQVREHLLDENARREKAEDEAGVLRGRLRQLEQDTFDLRRQVAQTRRAAMRDPLTGLANRRAYDERVAQEFARWKRFGGPLALLVLDVDDFKQINDQFGHKSGDKALIMVAKILEERLRETDFIARFGGEEFVVLLIGAERDDALRLADGMRQAVAEGGLHASGKPVKVTVSVGMASFADADTPEVVFERADGALYQAKRTGKNRVTAG